MIVASNWRPMPRGSLKGFFTLHLEPSGLRLHDCSLHETEAGRRWVALPSKPRIGRDGQREKDATTGKVLYVPVVEIAGKEPRERFQRAALIAVHALLGEDNAL